MARKGGQNRGLFERPPGSGIWWVDWYDHRGKRHREKMGTWSAARDHYISRKNMVREIKNGLRRESDLFDAKPLTLKEFIADCLPELRQLDSRKEQERYAKRWIKLIGHLPLSKVTAECAIKRRTAQLEKGLTPATCNRETAFLRAILTRAVNRGHLAAHPLRGLKNLPEDNKRTRTLSPSEEVRLEAAMAPEDFEVIAVAIDTGIRKAKLFALPWTHINLEEGWIDVTKAKAQSSRQIPMTKRVRAILERRWSCRKSAWVFANSRGNPMNPSNFINRRMKPAMEEAGIENLIFHDLRRTFASRLASAGKGGRILSGIMGHKSAKTTDRYAHLDPAAFKAAIQVLDEVNESRSTGGLRLVQPRNSQSS